MSELVVDGQPGDDGGDEVFHVGTPPSPRTVLAWDPRVQELQLGARRVIGRLMYSGYRICSIFGYDPSRAVEPGGRAGSMDRNTDCSQLSPRELQVATA